LADYYIVMRSGGSPRIVISGIGVVSPFGVGRECFWDHISRGRSGTRAITEFDASEFDSQVAAPVSRPHTDDVPHICRR
jgi:3-oxoacyl-(acyl-carrier-protein) synthase